MRHTLSVLVENKPGALTRITSMFARRGYNIESLVVSADAVNAQFSRMTITCSGDPETLEQIIKQVTKLIDVKSALDHSGQDVIETETALVKLKAALDERTELLQISEQYNAKVVDYGPDSLVLRLYGVPAKLDAFFQLMERFNVVELMRSGRVLMARGLETT